jgi:uronate dehydrogenase
MHTVLMTGAAGGIGTRLRPLLNAIDPSLRLSDVKTPADLARYASRWPGNTLILAR